MLGAFGIILLILKSLFRILQTDHAFWYVQKSEQQALALICSKGMKLTCYKREK